MPSILSLLFILALSAALLLSYGSNKVPSTSSLNSDVQILLHNDIYGTSSPKRDFRPQDANLTLANIGNKSTRGEAVLLLSTPKTNAGAISSCVKLGEDLWIPSSGFSSNNFLKYLEYHGTSSTQLFHIGGHSAKSCLCNAITSNGTMCSVSCSKELPVLCSQTAPYSYSNYTTLSTYADIRAQYQTTVHSGDATYTGYRDRVSFRFLGMRFAEEPERFTRSTLYKPSGDLSALEYGQYCAQPTGGGEDCLFLNVWTPFLPANRGKTTQLRPVMFWIYGGRYVSGMGSNPTFDGGNLASRGDVVVVTFNYRLGSLGFLALPHSTATGNYAISDHIAALDWVQTHIADFGGDPDRVTVFGQSAGAQSVRLLLHNKEAQGKFASAIMQSPPRGGSVNEQFVYVPTIESQYASQAVDFLEKTKCNDPSADAVLACLRAYDPVVLQNIGYTNLPVIDDYFLYQHDFYFNNTGILNKVPVMSGGMRDDSAFTFKPTNIGDESLATYLTSKGYNGNELASSNLFPVPDYSPKTSLTYANVSIRADTDSIFRCHDYATAYSATVNHVFPEYYYYQFNRSYQPPHPGSPVCKPAATAEFPFGNPTAQEYYKCHVGDVMYVFGTFLRIGEPARDDLDVPFSQFIIDTWTAWARSYNPNPDPRYLELRGYTNTTLERELAGMDGPWTSMAESGYRGRNLQWPSGMVGFSEVEQCALLGAPRDVFLTRDGS